MGRLDNKVAVITGAASGFGKLSAILFAKEGAKVVCADRTEEEGLKVVEEIKAAGGEATFIKIEVTSSQDCKRMCDLAVEKYGKLDIIFNNAGITGGVRYDFSHIDEEIFDQVLKVDINGVFYGIRHAAPYMIKNGGGSIISTASCVATNGCFGSAAYCAGKGAVVSMTVAAANEYGRFGIRANCISPYAANTPLMKEYMKTEQGRAKLERFKSGNPMGKLVDPMAVAYAALYLASDESNCTSGLNLRVDCAATVISQPVDMEIFAQDNPYDMD